LPRYDFFNFQDRGNLPSCIFKVQNLTTDYRVEEVNMHHCAKLCGDQLNHYDNMAIYLNFNMVAVWHLGFIMHVLEPSMESTWWSLSMCKISLESMQFR